MNDYFFAEKFEGMKNPDLASAWNYHQPSPSTEQGAQNWAEMMKRVGTVKTIPELLYSLDLIEKERRNGHLCDLYLFKGDIKPMWEDPANANGGRCILEVPVSQEQQIMDIWRMTVALCCSNSFETITGCTFGEKTNFKMSIWLSDMREQESVMRLWKERLEDNHYCMFSFVPHDSRGGDGFRGKKKAFQRGR